MNNEENNKNENSRNAPISNGNGKNSNSGRSSEPAPSDIDAEMQQPPERDEHEFDPKAAHKDAQERAKKRPILQKIANALQGKKPPYNELIVSSEPMERRVALLIDGILQKLEIERTGENRMVGAIFKGKIQNHEPGLKAAFVDIGTDKNAFLHYWDILPPEQNEQYEVVRQNRGGKAAPKKTSLREIPGMYPIGSDIVVQITKAQIGTKGPRTTTNIAIPGRYMVLMPFNDECGVSRKIEDPKERARLREILKKLTIPEGMGVILRTAGEGKRWTYFVRDLHMLLGEWAKIQERMKSNKPTLLYEEPDIVERTGRDFLTEEVDRILVDTKADYDKLLEYVEKISPRSKSKVALYSDTIPIFERYNIERQIEQTFQRKVPLPSGGEIVIDETEALVSIDINTGAHKNRDGANGNFILQVNLEAAKEIARQVRLRNIGGLIVVDFIDMKQKRDRNTIYSVMRREMSGDKAKTHVLPLSQLGLMQISRQRHTESNARGIYTQCPYCTGRGIVKSPRTLSVEIQRRVVSILRRLRTGKDAIKEPLVQMRILCHPTTMERIRSEDEGLLVEIEQLYNAKLSFRADPAFHAENFKVLDAASNVELR
jgi:ribonuclease G